MTRLFLPASPGGWPEPRPAPAWQRWLVGDSRWHLPADHPACQRPERWLLAHPARFQADLACLRLTGVQNESMPNTLADTLRAMLEVTLAERIERVEMLPSVLALRLKRPENTRFAPLGEALGENLQHCLPEGTDRLFWSQAINELQMRCHQQNLQQQGINGLWLSRPAPVPADLPRPERIAGGGPAADWARALGCPYESNEVLAPGGWLWLQRPPSWPTCPGGLRGRLARWRGRCVSVHAGLGHCWPERLFWP